MSCEGSGRPEAKQLNLNLRTSAALSEFPVHRLDYPIHMPETFGNHCATRQEPQPACAMKL
jgi:hypothetical protein